MSTSFNTAFCYPLNVGGEILLHSAKSYIRQPTILAGITYLIWPFWERIVAKTNLSDIEMFIAGTSLLHTATWLLYAFIFVHLGDYRGWLQQYKLPRTARMIPSKALLISTVKEALSGQLIIMPILLWILLTYVAPSNLISSQAMPMPSMWVMYLYYAGSMKWNAVTFYIAHRTLHEVPMLYRLVHKKHHNYVGSVSIAAEHAHPVEALLANSIPTVGFAIMFGVPLPVWFVWMVSRLQQTYESHSGYCFEGTRLASIGFLNSDGTKHHDFHHSVNRGNYGGALEDWMGGTLAPWIKHNDGKVF